MHSTKNQVKSNPGDKLTRKNISIRNIPMKHVSKLQKCIVLEYLEILLVQFV